MFGDLVDVIQEGDDYGSAVFRSHPRPGAKSSNPVCAS
jgi:hypothetical protein